MYREYIRCNTRQQEDVMKGAVEKRKQAEDGEGGQWGPKMAVLNDQQREFVLALADQPKQNFSDAARRAGYSAQSDAALRVTATRLAANPKILDALEEVIRLRGRLALPLAQHAIEEIAQSTGHKDQARAAIDILDRGGLTVVQKVEKRVVHEIISDTDMIASLKRMGEAMGWPIDKMLGNRAARELKQLESGTVTDAEYEEVPAPSTAGLEGLI